MCLVEGRDTFGVSTWKGRSLRKTVAQVNSPSWGLAFLVYKLVPLLWYTIWLPLRTTVSGMVPFTLALLMLLLLAEVNSCGESACSNEFSPSPLLPTPRLPILSHWEEEEINHKVWLTGAGLSGWKCRGLCGSLPPEKSPDSFLSPFLLSGVTVLPPSRWPSERSQCTTLCSLRVSEVSWLCLGWRAWHRGWGGTHPEESLN